MVWLLFKIIKDRPGIAGELGHALASYGINIRNYIGNPYAILVEAERDVAPALHAMAKIKDVQLINIFDKPITPLAFSRETFVSALEGVLKTFGTAMVPFLYRLGYEYGRNTAAIYGHGMDETTAIATFLYTATAFNRSVVRSIAVTGNEVVVEVANAFDQELGMPFTRGYVHGLVNAVTGRLHEIFVKDGVLIIKPL